MAKMCPTDGCRAKKGLCIHEKMMIGMMMVLIAVGTAHFGLGLF